jgi:hypothetical protein
MYEMANGGEAMSGQSCGVYRLDATAVDEDAGRPSSRDVLVCAGEDTAFDETIPLFEGCVLPMLPPRVLPCVIERPTARFGMYFFQN